MVSRMYIWSLNHRGQRTKKKEKEKVISKFTSVGFRLIKSFKPVLKRHAKNKFDISPKLKTKND